MARPSRLSEEEWEIVRRRVLAGESVRSIAKEYGIDEKSIRNQVKKPAPGSGRIPVEKIKQAAEKSLKNDLADPLISPILESMGVKDWDLFHNHKAHLAETSSFLNLAAKISAQNAHKLAAMAQNHLDKVDITTKMDGESRQIITDAMDLQAASNESAKQPMKLFEIATKQPPPPPEDKPIRIIGGMNTDPVPYDYPNPNRKSDDDLE